MALQLVVAERGVFGGGDRRGYPIPGKVHKETYGGYEWRGDWTVKWKSPANAYGVVAPARDGDDERTPEAIRGAFLESLKQIRKDGVRTLHVQLLAAGAGRPFHAWVSLVQMARAYGEWTRAVGSDGGMAVRVYVVDPAVVGLLQGSFIDLAEHIEARRIHIWVETIDAFGTVQRHREIVGPEETMSELVAFESDGLKTQPRVSAHPAPWHGAGPEKLSAVEADRVQDFGLVHGSTLVVDFREFGVSSNRRGWVAALVRYVRVLLERVWSG